MRARTSATRAPSAGNVITLKFNQPLAAVTEGLNRFGGSTGLSRAGFHGSAGHRCQTTRAPLPEILDETENEAPQVVISDEREKKKHCGQPRAQDVVSR